MKNPINPGFGIGEATPETRARLANLSGPEAGVYQARVAALLAPLNIKSPAVKIKLPAVVRELGGVPITTGEFNRENF